MYKRIALFLALVFIFSVTGCSSKGDTQAAAGKEVKKIKWVLQSSWPEGGFNQEFPKAIAKDIMEASGGRLEIEVLPAGAVVAAGDVLDAVNNGTIDMTHTWPGYFTGRMPALGLAVAQVCGLSPQDMMFYMLQGGGNEILQEILDKGGNKAVIFASGIIPPEIFMHSNKEIKTIDDLKGLKIRATGDWGAIIAKLGASPVSMALGEIFPAMERGVVDAAEMGSPALNIAAGMHELTKYAIFPGVHQTSTLNTVLISKKKWDELPPDLKAIVTMVCRDNVGKYYAKWQRGDIEAFDKMLEMEKQGKIKITKLTPEFQKKVNEVSKQYFADIAAKDEMSKKTYNSINAYVQKYGKYNDYLKFDY